MRTRNIYNTIVLIFMLLIVLFSIIYSVFASFNDHTYIATVTDKQRIVETHNHTITSYYLIFCKDDAGNYYEFKNEDSVLRMKYNSSSVYNQLEIGKKYKFTVVGFRIGLFSSYENIIKYEITY